MKKIMIIFLLLFLIAPIYSINADDDSLNELYIDDMDKNSYSQLDYVYSKVYTDENYTGIQNIMDKDFKKGDFDNNGILSFDEFKKAFRLTYSYYFDIINPYDNSSDYDFFMDTDLNCDGLIDFDEFTEISYIFTEDSFWDGYSTEEICQSEFNRADINNNEYLNYMEFKKVV